MGAIRDVQMGALECHTPNTFKIARQLVFYSAMLQEKWSQYFAWPLLSSNSWLNDLNTSQWKMLRHLSGVNRERER